MHRPRLAITMGDISGIGPEVVAAACGDARVLACCEPVVIGHPAILERACRVIGMTSLKDVECVLPDGVPDDLLDVPAGHNDSRSGDAAYRFLIAAIDGATNGNWAGIVTAPLSKAALHLAGHCYPGHTEILAERCGVADFGMMLYIPPSELVRSPHGIGVVHVTLHTSLASVPELISQANVTEKIHLVEGFMRQVGCEKPRIVVNALNPHAGEDGIFGREEIEIIAPAVRACCEQGLDVTGPLPSDTLYRQAVAGKYDAVVAMYHDQGHIPFKLIGAEHAVNVTLGLPLVRTSPSHGTAFDIAWQGKANPEGLIEAIFVASKLASTRKE